MLAYILYCQLVMDVWNIDADFLLNLTNINQKHEGGKNVY